MSVISGPKLIDSNLILYYDFYNPKKSFIGKPITNQYAIPTPVSNGDVTFAINGTGTFKRIYAGTFGGYTIQPTDVVYRYDLGTSGCHYHGNSATITAGQYATFTFDYFVSEDAGNYPETNYLANMENSGSGAGGAAAAPNSLKGVWQTVTFSSNAATSTGGINMYLYPGACNPSRLASSGYILYKNPQVIFSSSTNDTAPFVQGTRSNTQSLIDLTRNTNLTSSSLTYNANGTFSFNGSSDLIIAPENSIFNTQTPSVEVWIKTNALNQNGFWFEKGQVNTQYSLFQEGTNIVWRMNIGGITQLTATTASYISTSNWAQVVGTYTSGRRRLYINGALVNSDAQTGTIATNANGISIGAYGGFNGARGYYYNGSIGAVKIYNKELSADEVSQNFDAIRGRFNI